MTKTIERMSAYRVPLEPMRPTSGWKIAFLVGNSEPHLMDRGATSEEQCECKLQLFIRSSKN